MSYLLRVSCLISNFAVSESGRPFPSFLVFRLMAVVQIASSCYGFYRRARLICSEPPLGIDVNNLVDFAVVTPTPARACPAVNVFVTLLFRF
jgi:hypothetical protein